MSALPQSKLRFTLEEYFALERYSDRRFEYLDGEIVLMTGGSRQHGEIASNLIFSLRKRLAGKSCHVYGSDIALLVPSAPPYRYPDVSAVCDEPQFCRIESLDALMNPTLIIEVLSPTSESYDRGLKFEWYKSISSFSDYLLIAQDHAYVTQRTRQKDNSWLERTIDDPAAILQLTSMGCELPVEEIYEGVEFQTAP